SQRLGKNLPLSRRLDVQRGIVLDLFVQQQVTIEMSQRREFSPDAAAIDLIGEKLLQEIAHIGTASRKQQPLAFFQKLRELENVGGVRRDGKRRQSLLDSQVIEKTGK